MNHGYQNVWIVFDLDNGDDLTKRYCWFFHTRQQARNHIKHQKTLKYGARLSKPYLYVKAQS